MLSQGIGATGKTSETLDDLLSQIDGSYADWHLGSRQILEEIGRRFVVLSDERLSASLELERLTGVRLGDKR